MEKLIKAKEDLRLRCEGALSLHKRQKNPWRVFFFKVLGTDHSE